MEVTDFLEVVILCLSLLIIIPILILNDEFGEDNWNTYNEEQKCWLPMSRNSFYLQIPNFEKY